MSQAAVSTDSWLNSLQLLYPVPEAYRVPQLDTREALEVLRCGPEILGELLAAGLPHTEGPDGILFDRNDLINLALNSGTGLSMPERAVRFALRWMREDPKTWENSLNWKFSIQLSNPDSDDTSTWSHNRFLPEVTGGMIEHWESTAPARITPDFFEFSGKGPVTFSGQIRTEGKLQGLRSPRLREITQEFLDTGYRWARLPKGCQMDYETVLANKVAPCVSASLYLEKQFRDAGYEANTRGGWILGMLDLGHSWVEVVDDDGITKPVDAVFERLSLLTENPHPDLPTACLGSRINRLLPAAMPAGEPGAIHTNEGQSAPAMTQTIIRRMGVR